MNNLFRAIENVISESSYDGFKLSDFSGGFVDVDGRLKKNMSTLETLHFISQHRDDFEDAVVWRVPSKYTSQYNHLLMCGDINEVIGFLKVNGEQLYDFDSKSFDAAVLLDYFGEYDLSQDILNSVYSKVLRSMLYPRALKLISDCAYNKKMSDNAKKPRNRHYAEAVRIAKNTWRKYPTASKNGMCKKLYEYFNGGVSIDSLERWIKSAKLKPKVKSKATSFSLVTG